MNILDNLKINSMTLTKDDGTVIQVIPEKAYLTKKDLMFPTYGDSELSSLCTFYAKDKKFFTVTIIARPMTKKQIEKELHCAVKIITNEEKEKISNSYLIKTIKYENEVFYMSGSMVDKDGEYNFEIYGNKIYNANLSLDSKIETLTASGGRIAVPLFSWDKVTYWIKNEFNVTFSEIDRHPTCLTKTLEELEKDFKYQIILVEEDNANN